MLRKVEHQPEQTFLIKKTKCSGVGGGIAFRMVYPARAYTTPWKTNFDWRWPSMEDDFRWKMTFNGRRPSMDDDLWWKPTMRTTSKTKRTYTLLEGTRRWTYPALRNFSQDTSHTNISRVWKRGRAENSCGTREPSSQFVTKLKNKMVLKNRTLSFCDIYPTDMISSVGIH